MHRLRETLTVTSEASTLIDMPNHLTLTDRILYLKECAGSLRRLDKASKLPLGYCHALIGRIDNPHLLTLHKIADGADVPRAWVTNGDGELPNAESICDAVARALEGADAAPDDEPEEEPAPPAPPPPPPPIDAALARKAERDAAELARKAG